MAQTVTQQIENAAELARYPANMLVNIPGTARYLNISPITARRFVDTGKLPKVVIGGALRVPVYAIRQMLSGSVA